MASESAGSCVSKQSLISGPGWTLGVECTGEQSVGQAGREAGAARRKHGIEPKVFGAVKVPTGRIWKAHLDFSLGMTRN